MQKAWEDEAPAARFMRRLIRQRAVEFMRNPEYLKRLRYDYERARSDQKMFGHIWEEFGTSIFELIAEAHGEDWDADADAEEKKKEAAVNQRRTKQNDDVVATREESTRERKHQLQGLDETGLGVLEEDKGSIDDVCKTETEAREESKGRRADFYRRAGGT
jgi:hypothetical protein